MRSQLSHAGKRCVMWSKGSGPIVTRQDAEVVVERPDRVNKNACEVGCHVDVEVGELQDGEALEGRG